MGNYVKFSLTPGEQNDLRRYVPDDVVRTIWSDASDDDEIVSEVESVIVDIEAEVDSRLARKYNVPFQDPVPPVVIQISTVLVAEAVFMRSNGANDIVSDAAEAKRSMLESILNGDIVIAGATVSSDESAAPPTSRVIRGGEDRLMYRESLEF